MAQTLIDRILRDGRTIIADRRFRLRGSEAVDAQGIECDPCGQEARRFCAIGAFIRAAFDLVGDRENPHRLGWQVAALVANAGGLRQVEDDEPAWALAMLNDSRGRAAVLRAVDNLIEQRRT
jgi:hypothetical protein